MLSDFVVEAAGRNIFVQHKAARSRIEQEGLLKLNRVEILDFNPRLYDVQRLFNTGAPHMPSEFISTYRMPSALRSMSDATHLPTARLSKSLLST
jgi:hypothetical protein